MQSVAPLDCCRQPIAAAIPTSVPRKPRKLDAGTAGYAGIRRRLAAREHRFTICVRPGELADLSQIAMSWGLGERGEGIATVCWVIIADYLAHCRNRNVMDTPMMSSSATALREIVEAAAGKAMTPHEFFERYDRGEDIADDGSSP